MRRFLFFLLLLLFCTLPTRAAVAQSPIHFAFVRGGGLWLSAAGAEKRLDPGPDVSVPRFSPDGRFIAYSQGAVIKVIGLDGAGPWTLPAPYVAFAWSPTDDTLAIVTGDRVDTVAVTARGLGAPTRVATGWTGPAVWSPDGKRLALAKVESSDHLQGVAYVGVVPREGGEPKVILRDPFSFTSQSPYGREVPTGWSSDGQWLTLVRPGLTPSLSADSNEVLVLSAQGGTPWKLGETSHPKEWSVWEPTRPLLAFVDGVGREVMTRKVLKLASPTSGDVVTLTPPGYVDRDPAWAPSGRYLAFTRSPEGTPANMVEPMPGQAIYQMDVAHPTANPVPHSEGGFSPFIGRDSSVYWFTGSEREGLTLWHGKAPLLGKIGSGAVYYGFWSVDRVFDWWEPQTPARK